MTRTRTKRWLHAVSIAIAGLLMMPASSLVVPVGSANGQPRPDVFEQVWQAVNDRFFDPNFNGIDWQAMRERYGPRATNARSQGELAAVINDMLAELQTSHTCLYTPNEPAYYQLLGIFLPANDELRRELEDVLPGVKPQYSGIGIFTEEIDGKTFVSAVLDGGPAAEAGLMVGDQLLEADGRPFHPMRSFSGKTDQPVTLLIQRSPTPDSRRTITVIPKMLDGRTMFLDAMKASVQIIKRENRQVGYIRVWSYAGEQYQKELEQALLFGRLKDADALVLDLREGWGGASPAYLNLFTSRTLSMTSSGRDGTSLTFQSGWNKPVVMLVNRNTRSGKELLAYGFREHGIGPVVGSRTAGAAVAGYLSAMDDGSLLYLAVADVLVDGKHRIEGVGVTPDIEVPFSPVYARGADPQKERAVSVAAELAKNAL